MAFLDATAPLKLMEALLHRYEREYGWRPELNIIKIKPKAPKVGCIWRVVPEGRKNAWYPPTSLRDSRVREAIKRRIEALVERHLISKPAIITYKKFEACFSEIDGKRCSTLHFGALRSSNKLQEADVIFIVGTYVPNIGGLVEELRELLPDWQGSTKARPMGSDGTGPYRYEDKLLEMYYEAKGWAELYHAIHRGRPLWRPVDIYLFGAPPPMLELPVEELVWREEPPDTLVVMDYLCDLKPRTVGEATRLVRERWHLKWKTARKLTDRALANLQRWGRIRISPYKERRKAPIVWLRD